MKILTRNEMIEELSKGICEVTFTKVNGEERVMECTLPEFESKVEQSDKKINTSVIPVYDINKESWRSFKVDSVTEFKLKELGRITLV